MYTQGCEIAKWHFCLKRFIFLEYFTYSRNCLQVNQIHLKKKIRVVWQLLTILFLSRDVLVRVQCREQNPPLCNLSQKGFLSHGVLISGWQGWRNCSGGVTHRSLLWHWAVTALLWCRDQEASCWMGEPPRQPQVHSHTPFPIIHSIKNDAPNLPLPPIWDSSLYTSASGW